GAARAAPPPVLLGHRVVERLLPPDEPGGHGAARPGLARGERARERAHVRLDAAAGLYTASDLLCVLRRSRGQALPSGERLARPRARPRARRPCVPRISGRSSAVRLAAA